MPAYSLLLFQIILTNNLQKYIKRSATLKLLNRLLNLASINFRYKKTRSMSCYAFFKKWLLPSLFYDCFCLFIFLSRNFYL